MSKMPLPTERRVQPRLVGYDPTRPKPWLERVAYALFFSALWVMVVLAYGVVPGVFQTVFDALKLLGKEDFAPKKADWLIFRLAPAIVFVSAFLLMVAIPVAPGWLIADLDVGLLYIVAVSTLGAYGVVLGGLSQGNKWGLLGAFRAGAQLVSYEVPLAIALLSVGVFAGSLRFTDIVEHQQGLWHVVPLFLSFVVYLVASIAELKATPFDLPEAESEIVAGYNTEYSGMSFAFFFLAEFVELFLLPGFMVLLFFGGWHGPLFGLAWSRWRPGSGSSSGSGPPCRALGTTSSWTWPGRGSCEVL